MRYDLQRFINALAKQAENNENVAANGSPATSMAEDAALGEVAREQRRIIAALRKILRENE